MRGAQYAITAIIVAALSGCVQSAAQSTVRGLPDGFEDVDLANPEPFAAWRDDRSQFTITTFGSSSCAPIPTSVSAPDDSTIAVTFVPAAALMCTADMASTTHVFDTPSGIDADGRVTAHVLFDYPEDSELELPLRVR